MRNSIFLTALASLVLAACASMDHKTDAQRFALYDAHAGASVRNSLISTRSAGTRSTISICC